MSDDLPSEEESEGKSPLSLVAGRYKLLKRVGTGGAGVVFKAADTHNEDILVALKVLAPVDFKDLTAKARFEKEVLLTKGMQHSNLIEVYDYGTTETGQQYLTMEYIDGGTLDSQIYDSEDGMPFKDSLRFLHDIASGIGLAHSQGVVHRDLKPDNILITSGGVAKVADFGLARLMAAGHSITKSADTVGTPYYMAPEQFQHHRVDGRADIYSFGIIAYEMVNRCRPFVHDTYQLIALSHMRDPVPSFYKKDSEIPKWYETFVFRCTEKKPEARFRSMDEVVKYLEYEMKKMGLIEGHAGGEPWWIRIFSKLLGED